MNETGLPWLGWAEPGGNAPLQDQLEEVVPWRMGGVGCRGAPSRCAVHWGALELHAPGEPPPPKPQSRALAYANVSAG